MHKPDTSPSLNGFQQLIQEFFRDYPYARHLQLSADVFSLCYLDEAFGLSFGRQQSVLDYLQASHAVFNAAHLLLEKPTTRQLERRFKIEKQADKLVLDGVDEAAMLALDPGEQLLLHHGLHEALTLLDCLAEAAEGSGNITAARKKDLRRFSNLLRHILTAIYLQYRDGYKNVIKNPE